MRLRRTKKSTPTTATIDVIEFDRRWVTSILNRRAEFQRDIRETRAMDKIAREIEETGVLPGIIHLGELRGLTYVVDGQHRLKAFLKTSRSSVLGDVSIRRYETMADMGKEFERINYHPFAMTAEDLLRPKELYCPGLRMIVTRCDFIGYKGVRAVDRNKTDMRGPVLSVSVAVRSWQNGIRKVPCSTSTVRTIEEWLTDEEARYAVNFFHLCYQAFGRDIDSRHLWGFLNISILAWLYNQIVRSLNYRYSIGDRLWDDDLFLDAIRDVSSNESYKKWLIAKGLNIGTRAPAYTRLTLIFQAYARRVAKRFGKNGKKCSPMFPRPDWTLGGATVIPSHS